jgi:5-hydroxyisourate hydrolase
VTTLSTHVLDTASGEPVRGLSVHLSRWHDDRWERLADQQTDDDGRVESFEALEKGRYRIGFETGDYGDGFYPFVHVVFEVDDGRPHYHVPLLLSPYGYTTYRGS